MIKIRVLQLVDSLNAGGAEMLAVNSANLLSGKIEKSFICTTRKEGILKGNISKKVSYLFLNRKRTIDVKAIRNLIKFVKKNNIDIIHAHSTSYFLACCVKMFYPKIFIIWHDHFGNSEFLDKRKYSTLKRCSYFFSHIISVNEGLKLWSEDKLRCKQVYFINNFPFFSSNKKETKLSGTNGKRIVHLASLIKQKDHITLLKAFSTFQERYPDWTVHLIGNDFKDDYSKRLKNFIKKEGLKQKVFIYGAKEDVEHILNQSTIGVLSSISEGLPVALLEYGLAKLPVVVTNVGGCANVIGDNEYLIKSKDFESYAKALMNLMENESHRKHNAKKLHEKVKEGYSEDIFIKKLINLYGKVKAL